MTSFLSILDPVKHIVGERRVLDYLYGPMSAELRCGMARLMHDDPSIKKSDKRVGWNRFRSKLLEIAGVNDATCIADGDSKFEKTVRRVLGIVTKSDAIHAEAVRIVNTGVCPQCGMGLRRNNSMTGWWQCSQLGEVGFRADASKPSCSFQTFTV